LDKYLGGVNMEKSNCEALRKLARQAKNRLCNREFEYKGDYKVYCGGFLADYKLVQLNKREDEKFYEQVSKMLSEDIDTINPLGKLVDKTKLDEMNNKERERYIINLADRYVKMKGRFEKEHSNAAEFAG